MKINNFYVIRWDFNSKKIVPYDVMPYLRDCYREENDKPKTLEEFKSFVERKSLYQWWSRCEYEIILSSWPPSDHEEKWDIYGQVMLNLDIITKLLMEDIQ